MNQQQLQIWVNVVMSSVQGTAGSILDNPAANAIAIADEVLVALDDRMQPGHVIVPRPNVPKDLRGVG